MTKRDAILKAADQLFSKHGFGLTGVDAIAAVAGVTKRTLYQQFGSKAALFEHWLIVRDQQTRATLLAIIEAKTSDPKGQLLALFDVLAMIGMREDFHGCPFTRVLHELRDANIVNAGRTVAEGHKTALLQWFDNRLQAAGFGSDAQLLEEIAMLYEGTLTRLVIAKSPEPAYAAKRLLALRLTS